MTDSWKAPDLETVLKNASKAEEKAKNEPVPWPLKIVGFFHWGLSFVVSWLTIYCMFAWLINPVFDLSLTFWQIVAVAYPICYFSTQNAYACLSANLHIYGISNLDNDDSKLDTWSFTQILRFIMMLGNGFTIFIVYLLSLML